MLGQTLDCIDKDTKKSQIQTLEYLDTNMIDRLEIRNLGQINKNALTKTLAPFNFFSHYSLTSEFQNAQAKTLE